MIYNQYERKLNAMTISGYFIDYPQKLKGYRFYCHNHDTKRVEFRTAQFIENGKVNGNGKPQKVNIQETLMKTSTTSISS